MVVGAFPAAKLGVLFLKQISKPIANIIKNKAKESQFFRQYICMPPAQFYNWMEVKTKMWAMNLGKPVSVPQLSETMAIELGGNLLGETVIFVIGAGVLIFEYVRQSKKETAKEENTIQEKRELINTLNELAFHIEKQDAQLREMSRVVAELESKSWLQKLPKMILPEGKSDDAAKSEKNNSNQTEELKITKQYIGNFNPSDGIIFKALNLIENEIFYREQNIERKNGIITESLIYLQNDFYQ